MPDEVGQSRGRRRGVVGVAARGGRLLVIRRSQFVEAPGAYCFPGGAVEVGESEEAALAREFHEELGVIALPVMPLWRGVTSWQVELTWWLVELPPDGVPTPHPGEVESCQWLTPEEIRQLPQLLESNRQFLDSGAAGEFSVEGVNFSGK